MTSSGGDTKSTLKEKEALAKQEKEAQPLKSKLWRSDIKFLKGNQVGFLLSDLKEPSTPIFKFVYHSSDHKTQAKTLGKSA